MSNINFIITRHGYGCHNAIRPLMENNILKEIPKSIRDPELTKVGVESTIENGYMISELLKNNFNIETIHIIGCSGLIRSMESAYYLTRKWKEPPKKIYVFPLLREIDEGSDNKYSVKSRLRMDHTDSYAMKSINEQKEYLKSIGILEFFDFSFIENKNFIQLRKEPGDIKIFTQWFIQIFNPINKLTNKNLNVLIVSHAGVLKDFANMGFYNNSGFLLETNVNKNGNIIYKNIIPFEKLLPYFLKNYQNKTKKDYCPSNRCNDICNIMN